MANLPTRNNNPGDLKDPRTGTFRTFPSSQEGFDALKKDLQIKIGGQSKTGVTPNSDLLHFSSIYAPASDNNDPVQYANNLSKKLGVPVTTPISQLGNRLDDFASAIADNEGYQGNRVSGIMERNPNITPESFKQRIVEKYPDGVSSDGIRYSDMDATDLTNRIVQKYPDGVTNDGIKYADFLTKDETTTPESTQPTNDQIGGSVGNVIQSVFPGKQIGGAIGNSLAKQDFANAPTGGPSDEERKRAEQIFQNRTGKTTDFSKETQKQDILKSDTFKGPTGLQIAGDVGQAALMLAAPEASEGAGLLARLGTQVGVGAGFGLTGALASGETDVGNIAKSTAIGGIAGGAISGLAEMVGSLSKYIPKKLIQGKFEGLTDAEAQKFLEQKMGSKISLLNQSQKIVEEEGAKIDAALQAHTPDVTFHYEPGEAPQAGNAFSKTTEQFPEYAEKQPKLIQKIKSFVSNSSNIGQERKTILEYIDKIANGTASPFEKNQVRKVLDRATSGGYAKLAKALAPNAGHDLVMTFADALRQEIKEAVPETIPMFEELQKSVHIRNAVKKVANKGSRGLVSYGDVIPFLTGSTAFGNPIGGLATAALERGAESGPGRFAAAKTIQGGGRLVSGGLKASVRGLLPTLFNR